MLMFKDMVCNQLAIPACPRVDYFQINFQSRGYYAAKEGIWTELIPIGGYSGYKVILISYLFAGKSATTDLTG